MCFNQRSEKEIKRLNQIFEEIGMPSLPNHMDMGRTPVQEAKMRTRIENGDAPIVRPIRLKCAETGKTRFPSPSAANDAATARERKGAVPLLTYLCPHCKDYHMTSRKAGRR